MEVEKTGKLFKGGADRLLQTAVSGAIRELIQEAEGFLVDRLKTGSGGVFKSVAEAGKNASTGNYRRNLSTQVKRLNASVDDGGVIYGPWLEGVSSRNQSTRFKGYSSFRMAKQHTEKLAPKIFNEYIKKFARQVNR